MQDLQLTIEELKNDLNAKQEEVQLREEMLATKEEMIDLKGKKELEHDEEIINLKATFDS